MHVSEDVAAALLAHPAVARLDDAFASYLPGRRVVGVRLVGEPPVGAQALGAQAVGAGAVGERAAERVEVAVVLRPGRPIGEVVPELRARVAEVAGGVPVDVVVADLEVEG